MIGKSDDTGELFNVRKIVKNKIRCKKCGDIIESVCLLTQLGIMLSVLRREC